MLDNGVAGSLVDSELAGSLGLEVSAPVGRLYTGTGSLERRRAANVAVEIPGQLSFRAPMSAVDYSYVSQALGRTVGLVIGGDYFQHLSFLIAPSNRTFQLGPSGTLNVPSDMSRLVLKNDRPQVDLVIEGQSVTVTLDLGYSGMIGLNEAAWNRLGLDDRPFVEGSSVRADGRIAPSKSVIVEQVAAGPIEFPDVTVSTEPVHPGHGDGIIGMGLLSRFDFAVDITARRIWLLRLAVPGTDRRGD